MPACHRPGGAGTNNIPIDRCSESGIVVFNTPGANANAVKELVIAALLIASRDIVGGVDWVQEQAHTPNVDVAAAVEKGKSAFVGPELYRKTLGVIGLGAIGAWCATSAWTWGWTCTATTPTCLWTPPCGWTAMSMCQGRERAVQGV